MNGLGESATCEAGYGEVFGVDRLVVADQPESIATLHACLAEQRTLRRETRHHYASTGKDRQLAYSYVFVPPQTVMVHREDITDSKAA